MDPEPPTRKDWQILIFSKEHSQGQLTWDSYYHLPVPEETDLLNQSQPIDQPSCEISPSCKQSRLLLASTPNKVTILFNQASW